MILLFYVLLPLLNALADAVSIVFTRLFLSKAMQPSIGWTKIAINLLIDTVIAFACLTFLAFALPFAIEAFNAAIAVAGIPQVEWRSLLETARRAPFTEGLMVTGMLITTLLPTVVHLAVGGAALATAWQRPNPRHLDILRRWAGPVDGKPAAMPAERQAVESAFARRKTGALALAALTSFAVLFVLAHLYFSMLIALGWALPRIAFWSGDWASDLFH